MNVTCMQWAQSHFSAAHTDPAGRLHGHTWQVRAWWIDDGGDALLKREALIRELARYDHAVLPDHLSRAEPLAAELRVRLNASRVEIWRDLEGIGAEVSR